MPKKKRLRSLSRTSTSAAAAKQRRCQEDDQQRGNRLTLARLAHYSANNAQPAARRKNGDYKSIALQYDPESFQTESCLGEMQQVCVCGAIRFSGEPTSICCANGQVQLQQFHPPPEYLQQLYDEHHPHSKHFLENIRKYNCAFQMTSKLMSLLFPVAH